MTLRQLLTGLLIVVLGAVVYVHLTKYPVRPIIQPVAAAAPQLARPSAALSMSIAWTKSCLADGIAALVELGERDLDVLTDWALKKCRSNLNFYLVSELKRPQEFADAYIRKQVRDEVSLITVGTR